MVLLYGLRSFTQIESLMENEKVLATLKEIDYNLRCAISRELTYINHTNSNTKLIDKVVFVLKYMVFNVYDKHMHDENLSYIIIYL